MNSKNKILFNLSKGILNRNSRFKGIHKGESCYLIGNGASLKYYDLKKFNNRKIIGCNGLFLHSDFNSLNVDYYYTGHPYLYYPYWRNSYKNKIERNNLGSLYKRKILQNNDVIYFTSLTNLFGLRGKNIFYFHHFGKQFKSFDSSNLHKYYLSVSDALGGMLGLAIYMGFSRISLLGCDYAFSPKAIGHFFDYGKFPDVFDETPNNENIYREAEKFLDLEVVTPNHDYKGHILPDITYRELTGDDECYKENYQIVSKKDLISLSKINFPYVIFPKNKESH
jgi:hypothetical protein